MKREDGAVNWRGVVEEGIANARQARDGIRSGSPFSVNQGEIRRDGSLDYVRYDWGGKGLMALVTGVFILMFLEARDTYLDNIEAAAVQRGLIEKRLGNTIENRVDNVIEKPSSTASDAVLERLYRS